MTLLGLAAATAVVVDDVVGDVAALRSRQLAAGTNGPSLSSSHWRSRDQLAVVHCSSAR